MDKETYEALKIVLKLANKDDQWTTEKDNAWGLVSDWIDKVAKEYTEDKQHPKCEGCGEYLLDGQMVVKGENRHSACS